MRRYKFEINVEELNDECSEELDATNKTGCDDLIEILDGGLMSSLLGYDYTVKLVEYTND